MNKKKIIVTGGLGFIGSNLVKLLSKKGYDVAIIDKLTYAGNLKNLNFNKKIKIFKVDINNRNKIRKIIKQFNPSVIFNLAAETHVDRSIKSPKNFIKSNILGVFNLLEVLRIIKNKIKLIHISTDEVYGDVLKGRTSEKYPYQPSSPYAASKAASDHLVRAYIKTYKLPAIITNCSNNYGPKQHPEKLIPKLIYNIINNRALPIYGKGQNSREWIYVKDHCEALIKVFLKGKIGESYNIGSNKNLNNLQVTKEILKNSKKIIKLGKKVKINFVKDRPGHDIRYALNSDKIKKELNWYPKVNFSQGIRLTLNWYFENKSYYKLLSKRDILNRLGK